MAGGGRLCRVLEPFATLHEEAADHRPFRTELRSIEGAHCRLDPARIHLQMEELTPRLLVERIASPDRLVRHHYLLAQIAPLVDLVVV